jgi:hypothetical protein
VEEREIKEGTYSRFKPKETKHKRVKQDILKEPEVEITEEDPYLPIVRDQPIEKEPEIHIKEEPIEPEPEMIDPAPVKVRRTYVRKKPRWEYQVVVPQPDPVQEIPDDPKGGRVTRQKAKVLIQQKQDVHAEEQANLEAIKGRKKTKNREQKGKWNAQQKKNFTTYGDIYKSKPYKNYSTADSQIRQSDTESDSDSDSTTEAEDFDTLTEGSEPESDIESSDGSTERVSSGTPDTEPDESDGESSPQEEVFKTPAAPSKYPDHPSAAFREVGQDYPEYTGTAFPPKLRRTKRISPSVDPKVKKNLLKDLDEFVLGARPEPDSKDTLVKGGKQETATRRTRAAGPAPPIGALPPVPLERKPRAVRGKPWK